MTEETILTINSIEAKIKSYLKELNKSEHRGSIIFLAILIPSYLIYLAISYNATTARSILMLGFMQGAFYALIALGFAIIFGISRMFKLSIGGYYVLGAYIAFWLNRVLFLQFSNITLSEYSGITRISFTLLFIAPVAAFFILGLLYFKVFGWKIGSLNLIINSVLFILHRAIIVGNYGVVNQTGTIQALTVQIGLMAFGLALYYIELSTKQIAISLSVLNIFNVLINIVGTTPRSPALYISVLILSVLFVAAVSMFVDRYILESIRHNQTNVLIITFGIALFLQSVIPLFRYPWRPSGLVPYEFIPFGIENKTLEGIVPKTANIQFLGQTLSSIRVIAAIASMVILVFVYLFITRTRMGKAMKAVSEDPEAAWLVGINVRKVYLVSAGLGMGLSAAAGVLTSPFAASPSWNPFMGWTPLIFAIAVVTLGGIGSIFGSTIAGFIVGFTESTIAATSINLSEIVPLLVIFVIIIVRPRGLFGVEEDEE